MGHLYRFDFDSGPASCSLAPANYDPSKPTILYVHGWQRTTTQRGTVEGSFLVQIIFQFYPSPKAQVFERPWSGSLEASWQETTQIMFSVIPRPPPSSLLPPPHHSSSCLALLPPPAS